MSLLITVLTGSAVFTALLIFWKAWKAALKSMYARETGSSFECGLDTRDKARLPFSLRFFFILMLFLVFDVELTLLLHLPVSGNEVNWALMALYFFFILFLWMGIIEEWRRGLLTWKH